ncbi:MAG TPA: hypothetical protein VK595_05340 [Vicinamibacterales bacterium]|nr:hypothetical protein [Vicinamibacterales bacterium]
MFLFGGIYPVTLILPALACLALAAVYRPRIPQSSSTRALDLCVLLLLAATVVQLVPLPRPLLFRVSPGVRGVEAAFSLLPPEGARPLTINVRDSTAAAVLLGALILLFFTARRTFEWGGVRTLARIIAVTGLVLAGVALAQNATAKGLMYWRFAPGREGPYPFGPFVNRNHFATWAMMAVPVRAVELSGCAAGCRPRSTHAPGCSSHPACSSSWPQPPPSRDLDSSGLPRR